MGCELSCVKQNKSFSKDKSQTFKRNDLYQSVENEESDESDEVTVYQPPPTYQLRINLSRLYQRRKSGGSRIKRVSKIIKSQQQKAVRKVRQHNLGGVQLTIQESEKNHAFKWELVANSQTLKRKKMLQGSKNSNFSQLTKRSS